MGLDAATAEAVNLRAFERALESPRVSKVSSTLEFAAATESTQVKAVTESIFSRLLTRASSGEPIVNDEVVSLSELRERSRGSEPVPERDRAASVRKLAEVAAISQFDDEFLARHTAELEQVALFGLQAKHEKSLIVQTNTCAIKSFRLSEEFRSKPAVQQLGKERCMEMFQSRRLDSAAELIAELRFTDEVLGEGKLGDARRSVFLGVVKEPNLEKVAVGRTGLQIPEEFYDSEEYQKAAQLGLKGALQRRRHVKDFEELKGLISQLQLSESSLLSEETQGVLISHAKNRVGSEEDIGVVEGILDELLEPERREGAATKLFAKLCEKPPVPERASTIAAKYLSDTNPYEQREALPNSLAKVVECFNFKDFADLANFLKKNKNLHTHISRDTDQFSLERSDVKLAKSLHLTLVEADELKRAGCNLKKMAEERDFEGLAGALIEHSQGWKDEANIASPFGKGAKVFGYERMFQYLDHRGQAVGRDVSRHDALQGFHYVLKTQRTLGVEPEKFFHRILDEVRKDGGDYSAGSSYQLFSEIARKFPEDPKVTLENAKKHQSHEMVGQLIEQLDHEGSPGRSWAELKAFSRLQRLVDVAELIPELEELRDSGQENLYKFITKLAFHPHSRVDIDRVIQFWKEPDAFFNRGDAHANEALQRAFSPRAYTAYPYSDLTATQLRDAIVDGVFDKLQHLRPLEMKVTLPRDLNRFTSTRVALGLAIGSQAKKVKGEARKPGRVFQEANKIMPEGVSVKEFIAGEKRVNPETEAKLNAIIFDKTIGLQIETVDTVMTMHPKSSADGIMAGNDTACCMPFGAGKANVYWTNLMTAAFTSQVVRGEERPRTFVQSVMRLDQNIGVPFAKFREAVTSDDKALCDTLPDTVLRQEGGSILSADNRETAKNFEDAKSVALTDATYRIFFREYNSRFGEQLGLDQDDLPIGKLYSNTSTHLPSVDNHQVPRQPISYTDMGADTAYSLSLEGELPPFLVQSIDTFGDTEGGAALYVTDGPIQDLTAADIVSADYLEGIVYKNRSLQIGIKQRTPMIAGKDVANEVHQRRNLSLKYVDGERYAAHLIAYEGEKSGEQVIYVEDIAADPEYHGAGMRLMNAFFDRYRDEYLDRENPIHIHTELRDQTTYKFLKKRIERLTKDSGVEMELVDTGEYSSGEDLMHRVVIRPKTKETELAVNDS